MTSIALLSAGSVGGMPPQPASPPPATAPTTASALTKPIDLNIAVNRAQAAAAAFAAGDAQVLHRLVAQPLGTRFPPDLLRRLATLAEAEHGAIEGLGDPVVRTYRDTRLVELPILYERRAMTLRIGVAPDGQISRLRIIELTPRGDAARLPAYVDLALFDESPVEVSLGDGRVLNATLSLPHGPGPFPAVLIPAELWPIERGHEMAGVQVARDVAQGLATRGVVVLRYERPRSDDGGAGNLIAEARTEALAALTALRARPEVDGKRIFVLGHGYAGALAPLVVSDDFARTRSKPVKGLILAAVPARPALDVLLGQADRLASQDGTLTDDELADLEGIIAARAAARSAAGASTAELRGAPLTAWRDLDAIRPADDLEQILVAAPRLRVLILHGGRDERATAEDRAAWQAVASAEAQLTARLYPTLGHVLSSRRGSSSPADYRTPTHVGAEVIDDLVSWMINDRLPVPDITQRNVVRR